MTGRTYVLIFFFWAALTIITPTLVLWSESFKPEAELNGEKYEGTKDRKMIAYAEQHLRNVTAVSWNQVETTAPASAPASAPEYKLALRSRKLSPTHFLLQRNDTTSDQTKFSATQ